LRRVTHATRPAAEAERAGELGGEELPLDAGALRPRRVGGRLRVGELVVDLGQAAPVLGARPGVEQFPEVAARSGRAGVAGAAGEVEHVELPSRLGEQA